MSKHTPGPWSVAGQLIIGPPQSHPNPKATPSGRKVAEICWDWEGDRGATGTLPWSTAKFNADLIAAAPDLLKVVQAMVADLEEKVVALGWDSIEAYHRASEDAEPHMQAVSLLKKLGEYSPTIETLA